MKMDHKYNKGCTKTLRTESEQMSLSGCQQGEPPFISFTSTLTSQVLVQPNKQSDSFQQRTEAKILLGKNNRNASNKRLSGPLVKQD